MKQLIEFLRKRGLVAALVEERSLGSSASPAQLAGLPCFRFHSFKTLGKARLDVRILFRELVVFGDAEEIPFEDMQNVYGASAILIVKTKVEPSECVRRLLLDPYYRSHECEDAFLFLSGATLLPLELVTIGRAGEELGRKFETLSRLPFAWNWDIIVPASDRDVDRNASYSKVKEISADSDLYPGRLLLYLVHENATASQALTALRDEFFPSSLLVLCEQRHEIVADRLILLRALFLGNPFRSGVRWDVDGSDSPKVWRYQYGLEWLDGPIRLVDQYYNDLSSINAFSVEELRSYGFTAF